MISMLLGFIALIVFIAIIWEVAQKSIGRTRVSSERGLRHLERSDGTPANEFLETDLRLTYKRFKELYPFSRITYEEYKQLQAKKAYKRSVSSQRIKRMVR